MGEIRALTVQQPWASAIAYGTKRVENRTWPTTFRGLLAIHAGKAVDWAADDPAWTAAGLAPYRAGGRRTAWTASLPLGAVVAVADLAGCHLHDAGGFGCGHDGRWSTTYDDLCADWATQPDQWHWQLAHVRPLAQPVPCKGALRLWRLPGDVEAAVRAQLGKEAADG